MKIYQVLVYIINSFIKTPLEIFFYNEIQFYILLLYSCEPKNTLSIILLIPSFITKITVESITMMDTSDVMITTTSMCEGGVTKVTLESLTLMDRRLHH